MVRRINLVPASERARTKSDVGLLVVFAVCAVVIALVGLSYYYYNTVLSTKQDELTQLQAENERLRAQLASLAAYEEAALEKQQTEALVQTVYAGRTLVSDILGDISLVVPGNVWFSNLSLNAPDPPVVATAGAAENASRASAAATEGDLAISATTYAFEDVATFMVRLEQVPGVHSVALGSAGLATEASSSTKESLTFGVGSVVINTQDPTVPLPLVPVEVSGG